MTEQIEIISVSGGKFHRPIDTTFSNNGNAFRDAKLMRCGRSLVPLNFFETIADANRYTGGRLERYICQQCEKKVSHLWRVPAVLENGIPNTPVPEHRDSYGLTIQDRINQALTETLTDIGQLDKPTLAALNRLVKKGLLSKGKGGPFPALKTVYAVSGFDYNYALNLWAVKTQSKAFALNRRSSHRLTV